MPRGLSLSGSKQFIQLINLMQPLPSTHPCIAMVLRANHQIGTGHLMRLRSLIPYLKQHALIRLYVYALEENLRPLCQDYDEVFCFATKEEILAHLLALPLVPQAQLSSSTQASVTASPAAAMAALGSSTAAMPPMDSGTDTMATMDSGTATTTYATDSGNSTATTTTEYLPQILIIDDYAIDSSFEAPLYERCKLFVVDDLFDRPHKCHMLLDQTLKPHEEAYRALCNHDCQLLLGSRYSLTLECFYPQFCRKLYQESAPKSATTASAHPYAAGIQQHGHNHNHSLNHGHNHQAHCSCVAHDLPLCDRVRQLWQEAAAQTEPYGATAATTSPAAGHAANANSPTADSTTNSTNTDTNSTATPAFPHVLVNFGGADPVGACLKVSQSIVQAQLYQRYAFTMLSGAANPDYEAIQALVATIPEQWQKNFCLIRHCTDVADLLLRHDMAIGAYGGMYRERIAAGLPTVGVIIADNQAGTDEIVEHYQLGLSLKLSELSNPQAIAQALERLYQKRQYFTSNCLKVYDGQGLQRIVQAILSLLPA